MDNYNEVIENNAVIRGLKEKIEEGSINSKHLDKIASISGILAGKCMSEQLRNEFPNGQIQENDVRRIISPIMKANYKFVSEMAAIMQTTQYKKINVGLKAGIPEYNVAREDELVKEISARSFEDGFFG